MRLLLSGMVIAVVAILGVWIVMQRRREANTPALDTVAGILDGVKRENGLVSGTLKGFTVQFVTKQYRQSRWHELTIAAPGAKILLEMKAQPVGATPELVRGAPEAAAKAMIAELRDAIAKMHPKTIDIDDTRVKLVADRLIDVSEARAFVQLGIDLATRSTGGAAISVPAGVANTERQEMRDAQGADRSKRIVMALIVLVVVAGGIGALLIKVLEKRKAVATQTDR